MPPQIPTCTDCGGGGGGVGPAGPAGAAGPAGPAGAPATPVNYAEFYALMPGDNAATLAAGGSLDFPRDGATNNTITRGGVDTFVLPNVGVYEVSFQASISEPGQLVVALDGTELPHTVIGRATGTSQLSNTTLVQTTAPGQVLSIRNPAGNPAALTITPVAGGASAVSANLVIKQIG